MKVTPRCPNVFTPHHLLPVMDKLYMSIVGARLRRNMCPSMIISSPSGPACGTVDAVF
jgi:hypothetical protein